MRHSLRDDISTVFAERSHFLQTGNFLFAWSFLFPSSPTNNKIFYYLQLNNIIINISLVNRARGIYSYDGILYSYIRHVKMTFPSDEKLIKCNTSRNTYICTHTHTPTHNTPHYIHTHHAYITHTLTGTTVSINSSKPTSILHYRRNNIV